MITKKIFLIVISFYITLLFNCCLFASENVNINQNDKCKPKMEYILKKMDDYLIKNPDKSAEIIKQFNEGNLNINNFLNIVIENNYLKKEDLKCPIDKTKSYEFILVKHIVEGNKINIYCPIHGYFFELTNEKICIDYMKKIEGATELYLFENVFHPNNIMTVDILKEKGYLKYNLKCPKLQKDYKILIDSDNGKIDVECENCGRLSNFKK